MNNNIQLFVQNLDAEIRVFIQLRNEWECQLWKFCLLSNVGYQETNCIFANLLQKTGFNCKYVCYSENRFLRKS